MLIHGIETESLAGFGFVNRRGNHVLEKVIQRDHR